VGSTVTIAGVGVTGYNGTFTITSMPSATQFTYAAATTGLANSGAGTATSTDINKVARTRLSAFLARGGGYIASSQSTTGFSYLTSAVPALVEGSLTQGSQSAYGGIAMWNNAGGADSPITGPYPGADLMFLPSNTTYFSATPTGAVVDARYPSTIATIGPQNGYLSGMWLNRNEAANNAPVLVHGKTTADSRYVAYATNPFSRYDAEREWPLIFQAAVWTDMTDEGDVAFTVAATAGDHGAVSPGGVRLLALGVDQTYSITPETGYHIEDVVVDGSSVGAVPSYAFKNVAEDHTIAATFAVDSYDITASAGPNGSITPSGTVTIDYGQDQAFTIAPAPGYSVLDVLVDGMSVGAVTTYTFTDVAEAHTISATFAVNPVPWKVTFSLSKYAVSVNGSVKFYGSVSSDGAPASGSVVIQRKKSGGSWTNWKTATLNGSGKYSLTVKMTAKGTKYYRTMMASDAGHVTTYSRSLKLRVH
jgi:hypothetical protein